MSNRPDSILHTPDNIQPAITKRQGAHLPHWEVLGAKYFITFRQADSLPSPKLFQLKQERDQLLNALLHRDTKIHPITQPEINAIHKLFNTKVESYLDSGHGTCAFNNPKAAEAMSNGLFYFHEQRYNLHAWCVMPNHVHCIVEPYKDFPLSKILKTWKSFSAREINLIIGRTGAFWQSESYDHILRDEADYRRATDYILKNPERAKLKNWKWVGITEATY